MAEKEAAPNTPKAVVVCMYPDVCLSPEDPVPYQIVAKYSDMVQHSQDVRVTGYLATTEKSYTSRCYNDDPGSGGGVKSGVHLGVCKPAEGWSSSVRTNGARTLRHDAVLDMNGPGPSGPFNTKGKTVYPGGPSSKGISADGTITKDTNPALPETAATPEEPGTLGKVWDGFQESINSTIDMGKATAQVVYSGVHTLLDGTTGGMLFEPWELHAGVTAMENAGAGMTALIEHPGATTGAIVDGLKQDPARGLGGLLGGAATALVGGGATSIVRSGTGMLKGAARKAKDSLFKRRAVKPGGEGGGGDGVKVTHSELPGGATFKVRREGDKVRKTVREEMKDSNENMYRLSDEERAFVADNTAEYTNQVHELMPDTVPELKVVEPGTIEQAYVEGMSFDDLPVAVREAARDARDSMVAAAQKALGLEYGGDFPNGFFIKIDENLANFRFTMDGVPTSWFDPVYIGPPTR